MRVLHIVPGLDVVGNGIAVSAKLIAAEQGADLVEARLFARGESTLDGYDEVWVHSCWLPMTLKSCWRVLRAGKPLVRMTHANLDPVRLRYHGWKKWLVGPVECAFLRRSAKIVATCEAEKGWIQSYLCKRCPPVEVTDIKRFFKLGNGEQGTGNTGKTGQTRFPTDRPLHLLYLGRRHPLKGIEYLEAAGRQLQNTSALSASRHLCVRFVSNISGDELEKVWGWCDVLVLPTLSDNFGLVIAEALERGKRVITTDGAPAWGDGLSRVERVDRAEGELWSAYGGRLIYLKGYRDGSPEERIQLLKSAIEGLVVGASNGRNCKVVIDKYA